MNSTRSRPSASRRTFGDGQMPTVDGIERAAQHSPCARRRRRYHRARCRHPHGCPSHSSSTAPMRTVSPASTPGPDELPLDAQASEVALEALGRLLVVEVCLRRETLDAPSPDAERAVVSRSTAKPMSATFEAMDDDPRRLTRLGQLVASGSRPASASSSSSMPCASLAEMATTSRPSAFRAASNAARRSPAAGRSSLLATTERRLARAAPDRAAPAPRG